MLLLQVDSMYAPDISSPSCHIQNVRIIAIVILIIRLDILVVLPFDITL